MDRRLQHDPWRNISVEILTPNTKLSYLTLWKKWHKFALSKGYSPLPVNPEHYNEYVETTFDDGKKSIIEHKYKVAHSAHKYNELPRLDFGLTRRILVKRAAVKREVTKQAPILYFHILEKILAHDKVPVRDKALVSFMFDTMVRGDDLSYVQWQDIKVFKKDGDKYAFVRLYKTKGKVHPEGEDRIISPRTVALLDQVAKDPKKDYRYRVGPEFKLFPGQARNLRMRFEKLSKIIGCRISSHSCRIGAAIEMHNAGISDVSIMRNAGWNTTQMLKAYTRKQGLEKTAMSQFMKSKGTTPILSEGSLEQSSESPQIETSSESSLFGEGSFALSLQLNL